MNTLLAKLFEKYNVSDRNRYEILQIFSLLPDIKKTNLLSNFEALAFRLRKIEEEIALEKDVLIGSAVERIGKAILEKRKNKGSFVKTELEALKNEI